MCQTDATVVACAQLWSAVKLKMAAEYPDETAFKMAAKDVGGGDRAAYWRKYIIWPAVSAWSRCDLRKKLGKYRCMRGE